MKKILLAIAAVLVMSGCTDAKMKQWTTLGNAGEIVCYSGTLKIYEGKSTGKINAERASDGWFLEEAGTGKLIRVSGACVIRN